eukprot:TRINITY_DN2517_c0_g1_i2.p1 TRINITY_DN2517_c0_g1~~TRINITY_DN2517_c0_g1_i2.p1  ORF type:complete len:351 (+),score=87.24 TRINITY_DN2517_c0_g1_i2:55-1053(+)
MAGAGQPWYMPALWPAAHIMNAVTREAGPSAPTAAPILDLTGHLTSIVAALRSYAIAHVLWTYTSNPLESGAAAELSSDWILPIVARNVAATWAIAGFWDWLLYFSPLKNKFTPFKLNPIYPSMRQFAHDSFWSTSSSCTAAALEVMMLHLWATGKAPYAATMESQHVLVNVFWVVFLTHWRVIHFWAIHRFMHPWFTTTIPDVGKLMYKMVHSLHHQSRNPTAFSGTSMHPVESTLYYSAALVPCLFGAHPTVFLAVVVDCAVGAWLGHDGFQWPGSGDYFHQIHHQWYDCNYGATHIPIDYWMGTFKDKGIPGASYDGAKREASTRPKDD